MDPSSCSVKEIVIDEQPEFSPVAAVLVDVEHVLEPEPENKPKTPPKDNSICNEVAGMI